MVAAVHAGPRLGCHVAPVPTSEGKIDHEEGTQLTALETGTRATIVEVSDDDSDLLRYLSELGLTLGAMIEIREIAPFLGPITLEIEGAEDGKRAIAHHVARSEERRVGKERRTRSARDD